MMDYNQLIPERVRTLKPSGIRKFFDIASTMDNVLSLSIGEPDFVTPWVVRDAGIDSLVRGRTFYTGNAGLIELRKAICEYNARMFELEYTPDQTLVTVGGSEAIDLCFRTLIGKFTGHRGVFYEIVGQDVAAIDGFYSHSAFETYHTLAVLNPKDPDGVCRQVKEALGISCMVVDANDIDVEILGKSPDLADKPAALLADLIRDNPAGQDDELTPFVIVRDIGDREAMPYVPVEAVDGPPPEH
mgnify:CR=1 FL=1